MCLPVNAIVSAAVLALLTVTTVLLSVPQLVRLIRTGDPSGLSSTSLLFGAAAHAVPQGPFQVVAVNVAPERRNERSYYR